MKWTKPESDREKISYSKFAGVLSNYENARWFVQFIIWLPIAALALTQIVTSSLEKFFHLPFPVAFPLLFLATLFMHKLLYAEYQTYWFDKLDKNPDTNSGIWFSLILCAGLGALEYVATSKSLINTVAEPVAITYENADADYKTKLGELNQYYEENKTRLEDNFQSQAETAAPTLFANWQDWEGKSWKDWADKQYIKNMRKSTRSKFYSHPKVAAVMAEQQTQLNKLQKDHDAEMAILKNERATAKSGIDTSNAAAIAEYNGKILTAKGMGGLLSVFCLSVFLWCVYKEVYIKCLCGIYPIREFTDLKAHGSNSDKFLAVIGDIFTRSIHARLFKYHRNKSDEIGELKSIDGRLLMEDGNYQESVITAKSLNGKKVLDSLGKN